MIRRLSYLAIALILVAVIGFVTFARHKSDGYRAYHTSLAGPYNVEDYVVEVLNALAEKTGKPASDFVTENHVIALMAFGYGEGGNINNLDIWNLWNTNYSSKHVQPVGNRDISGVQAYGSFNKGVNASADTMLGNSQNRLSKVLSEPNSTPADFMTALTYFNRYPGNHWWAGAAVIPESSPEGVPDPAYYNSRMKLVARVTADYQKIASLAMGPPGKSQQTGTHITTRPLRYHPA